MNKTLRLAEAEELTAAHFQTKQPAYSCTKDCNLCGHEFHTQQRFRVFCDRCKNENELYRFSEWLPTGGTSDYEDRVA